MQKSKETPAKCTLCGGNLPANYKHCEHYHNLIKGNNTFRNNTQRTPPVNTNIYRNSLTKFLDEFQGLFNQLLQRNSVIINMFTLLINKIN